MGSASQSRTQTGGLTNSLLGKFDENYTGTDIEDIEFGLRMKSDRVFLNRKIIISHHFGIGGLVGTIITISRTTTYYLKKYFNLLSMFFAQHPTYLIFYVTSRCNSKCRMCFNWKYNSDNNEAAELNLREIEAFAKKAKHIHYATLGGGEPFLREDLAEICGIFYQHCKTEIFSIPTNCQKPTTIANTVEEIIKHCPTAAIRISLSIDGIGDKHDEIRNVKGNFSNVLRTHKLLKNLQKRHPNIELIANTTFTSYNQDEINGIFDYIQDNLALDGYNITLVRGNTRENSAKDIDISKYEAIVNRLEKEKYLDKTRKSFPLRNLLKQLPYLTRRKVVENLYSKKRVYTCHAIKKMIVMDSYGNIFPCEMLPDALGNITQNNESLDTILTNRKAEEILSKIKNKECNCNWECAIQNSIVFNYKKYPSLFFGIVRQSFNLSQHLQ